MITKEEAIQKFKDILLLKTSWKTLSKSQFVHHLAIFVSWCLRAALWKVERMLQEFFLSTALNESSILAHAEDREYIPRKPQPANGTGSVTNGGTAAVTLPIYTPFQSSAGLDYVTDNPLVIAAGDTAAVGFIQQLKETIETIITAEEAFYEILFDKEYADTITDFTVYVDTGDGYEEWDYRRLFQNSNAGEKIYDEFFTHTGLTGIRFGNEYVGTVLPVNTPVKIELWLTEGDTSLAENQALSPVGEILDAAGLPATLTAVTVDAIAEGEDKETIEEMRANLHYWPIYNEKLVWDDDYIFFIKRTIAGILWIKVWGEEEAEAAYGADITNINKIFVSAYAKDRPNLGTEVITRLEGVPLLNRKFAWVAPIMSTFGITITGKIARTKVITEVIQKISTALLKKYGKNSTTRLSHVAFKDIYKTINDLGYFEEEEADFEIVFSGTVTPADLNEMVYLDDAGPTITLTYL